MTILLTGAQGQLGRELARSLLPLGQVVALDRSALDLSDLDQVRTVVRALQPRLIINAAAYTAVDQAETDRELAWRVNAQAPAVLAQEAGRLKVPLVHFSSDYVFDGCKPTPYLEDDPAHPLNVYGSSKLAGEQAIAAAGIDYLLIRTSWLYARQGKNFLTTIERLARERGALRVVADQVGAPTWTRTVAEATAGVLALAQAAGAPWWADHGGLYHLSAQGATSWHGFARAIVQASGAPCSVEAIATSAYPLPARRPMNSVLSSAKWMAHFGPLPAWDVELARCLAQ